MHFQVINSPFNHKQTELLNQVLPTLTDSQKIWLNGYLNASQNIQNQAYIEAQKEFTVQTTTAAQATESTYSRNNPFKAEVLENINLNGRGSNKETRHLELSLEGSDLTYEPGDSLGIYPQNDPALVELLLNETNWNPKESVIVNMQGDVHALREALTSYFEITVLTKPLLQQAVQLTENQDLKDLVSTGDFTKRMTCTTIWAASHTNRNLIIP